MIHKLDDGTCVISENEVWRPGCFENEQAAQIGSGLDDETLERLQEAARPEPISLAAVKMVAHNLTRPHNLLDGGNDYHNASWSRA